MAYLVQALEVILILFIGINISSSELSKLPEGIREEYTNAMEEYEQYKKYEAIFPFIKQYKHAESEFKKYVKNIDYNQDELQRNMPEFAPDQILDLLIKEYRCLNFYECIKHLNDENLGLILKQPIFLDSIVKLLKEVIKKEDFLYICDYLYATHHSLMHFYSSSEEELNNDLAAYDRLNENIYITRDRLNRVIDAIRICQRYQG